MKISVVIPVYGCREALPELYQRLTNVLTKLVSNYEIILVNDGCPQNSWEVIERLCKEDSHVVGLELSRNFGQLQATAAGVDYSTGDWVVVMDCDLQDRPEEIPRLYAKAKEGYDVVFARRKERRDSKFKVFVSDCFYKVYSFATGQPYDGSICNFSISNRNVIDNYCKMREWHRGFVMYIQWMGFREAVLDVEHQERFAGESGYNFKKRMKMAMDLLTSQSDKLLQLTVKSGLLISAIAAAGHCSSGCPFLYMHIQSGVDKHYRSNFPDGWIDNCQRWHRWYLRRKYFYGSKHRPLYIVRQQLNGKHREETLK